MVGAVGSPKLICRCYRFAFQGVGVGIYFVTEVIEINGKSAVDWAKDGVDWIVDGIAGWFK